MAYCRECGTRITEGDAVCSFCGASLPPLSIEFTEQIKAINKKIEKDNSNPGLYIELGDLYLRHEWVKQSIAEYQKALKIDRANFAGHLKLGDVYSELKEFAKAEESYRGALHVNPASLDAVQGLFRAYYGQQKFDEALVLGENILRRGPVSLDIRKKMISIYRDHKKDMARAIEALEMLAGAHPADLSILKELAKLLEDNGESEKATGFYQKILALEAKDCSARLGLAKHHLSTNENEKALDILKGLLTDAELPGSLVNRVRCHLAQAFLNKGFLLNADNTARLITYDPACDAEEKKLCRALFDRLGTEQHKKNDLENAVFFYERARQFGAGDEEQKRRLETARQELRKMKARAIRKKIMVGIGVAAIVIVLALGWALSRISAVIKCSPADSLKISLGGNPVKTRTDRSGRIVLPSLPMGVYGLRIEKDGYEPWQGSLKIGFGYRTIVPAELMPIYGSLSIRSEPAGVSVYLDQALVGQTPFFSEKILSKEHLLVLAADGYGKWRDTIMIRKSATTDLGVVKLKDLNGSWRAVIDDGSTWYKTEFTLRIQQRGTKISIKYHHQPSVDQIFSGELKGQISANEFIAEGKISYKSLNVFYWTTTQRKLSIKGKMSEDWHEISGIMSTDGFGEHSWSAVQRKRR